MSPDTGKNGSSFQVEVGSIRTPAAGVAELVLVDPAGGALRPWEPGAHLDFHLPNGLVRQYSLTSDPADTGCYRVAVLREPDGRGGSAYVHDELRAGDVLTCTGPRNNFVFHPAAAYRFVAGGIGITPLVPMIESAEQAAVPWTLAYFGRTAASMAWAGELAARFPGRVLVRPDDVFGVPDLAAVLPDPADGELVYACGPHGLLDALAARLGDRARGVLHVERFAPIATEASAAERQAFQVTLDRSGIELEVPADKSILEVMEERGIPVISSCREGTCGTCETAVLAGSVDHRDSILTEDERAATETMMICCSRGIGAGLVIDA
ncbi:Ferredoxin-NADP reductase [Amycolatopsis pretoriensis]|uniref:Ferredoxin-NADP reductase n=1 Tax=Amycolatopsis pretoriensis TaxID=218821 RepID=A0A1H5R1W5_9PSEU|nr:PDR/VanB family oxidoreductase [Amycolatopsis pretoriensis]SEF32325.1 Ferredoxin-NADP reductase [Amycolatopsis pretoriensis]